MTAKQALKKWQKIFNLCNWEISVEECSAEDNEELEDNLGYVEILFLDNKARIFINKEALDKEEVVIHEMLHIVVINKMSNLRALLDEGMALDLWEACDEALTRALTKIVRRLEWETKRPRLVRK